MSDEGALDVGGLLRGLPPPEERSAFMRAVAVHWETATAQRVSGWIDLGPEHQQPWGVVHGGVYATIVEAAGSLGATLALADRDLVAVGSNNNTHFLRSVREGRVRVVGEVLHVGRTQQLWDVSITRDDDGKLVATGQLRVQHVPRAGAGTG